MTKLFNQPRRLLEIGHARGEPTFGPYQPKRQMRSESRVNRIGVKSCFAQVGDRVFNGRRAA